ncbi:MAG: Inosine-5'-monophosphate dehydrogenase [Methanomassiliicoccales archaeon PtaU1.Bin124]|nr:MAG: Inosine-5'-monophosphate dehydrogenase [Methanomassiliicoccales archaeon PtaU1.Bin124]
MTTVGEVMTTNPIVAQVPGSRNEVLKTMVKHNLTGLPVVRRSDGTLAGMITRQDIFAKPEEDQAAMIMNRDPPTIGPKDMVEKAAAIFSAKKLRHLPVVENHKLVGILTPTDLLAVVERKSIEGPVEKVIKSPCVPIYQDATLAVASITLTVSKSTALPVLDEAGHLVGIISDRDIFNRSYVEGGEVKTTDEDEEEEVPADSLKNVMKLWHHASKVDLPGMPVKDIMVRNPITVFKKTAISEAARIMRKNDFGQLPVRDAKDNLLAMIYDHDVISILAEEEE